MLEGKRLEAEQRYVAGDMPLRELAKEMGVSAAAVYGWSKAGKWPEKRKKVQNRALKKAAGRAADKKARELDKLTQASTRLEDALAKAAEQFAALMEAAEKESGRKLADGFRAKNLQSLAAAIGNALETRMKIAGLMTEAEAEKLRLEKSRLDLEEKKAELSREEVQGARLEMAPELEELAK